MPMKVTGTQFNFYHICRRKLWLFSAGINMEQESDLVYEGRLIHESSYPQRSSRYEEIEIDGIKVDYYDARNKVIHEIKKSSKMEGAHEWQLKYYMYIFERHGISGVTGILEYPLLHKTKEILLTDIDREEIGSMLENIMKVASLPDCPPAEKRSVCRNCSYYEFCNVHETDEGQ